MGPGHWEVSFHGGDTCTEDAHDCVRVYTCIHSTDDMCVCLCAMKELSVGERGFCAMMKLDFSIEENVHLNVSPHIGRAPVKYGGFSGIV